MSDSRSAPLSLELITNVMNDLAREIGMMEADDPKWPAHLKELSVLTQLRRAVKFAGEPVIGPRMDDLCTRDVNS